MKDIIIFLIVMMLLCAGALYLKSQAGLEDTSQRPINPTVTVLEKEVAAVKAAPKPVIDPATDPLAPVTTSAPPVRTAPAPRETFDPGSMNQ